MSANAASGIGTRRFPPEFLERIAAVTAKVFAIGLLERFGVVTSLCCPLSEELFASDARKLLSGDSFSSDIPSRHLPSGGGLNRSAALRREIGGLEISGMSADVRGNLRDDFWVKALCVSEVSE